MHPLAYTPNPLSPLETRYGAVNPFAELGTAAVKNLMNDPAVQQQINQIQYECKEQAKVGINEWTKENWGYLVAGAATLVGLNYLMLAIGVLPLVSRRAR